MQPRPPSSSTGTPSSNRPFSSSRARSALRKSVDLYEPPPSPQQVNDSSIARPTSSFSKYRPLPAIGSPSPTELEEKLQVKQPIPPEEVRSQADIHKPQLKRFPSLENRENHHTLKTKLASFPGENVSAHHSMSINSSNVSSPSQNMSSSSQNMSSSSYSNFNTAVEGIEKLDLSQLEKPPYSSRRRKSLSNSPSHGSHKISPHKKTQNTNGELYDADDDDSDSSNTKNSKSITPTKPSNGNKKPVIIPSPDHYEAKEILLAVKLPINGTRHQRFFHTNERLRSIVEFAEEVAGQDFGGYVLVSSAPRILYTDLHETIAESGLRDKSVLHLEELD
ncbi:uncharacterized protein LOC106077745 [Biomphalaria glabrata]|uniref:Uncharacterized protein LOC106077745 n=1 Tax=Biomphalaria glabrata TaxID=6526 RepID=A0A9W2YMN7_BIOGL|nr:uncharacterized protein LOC106077745 [Biomphalaria glabrata]XP_055863994.1 uncharacterized protein LOC106077745 [Biomphalaria glabrata]KAI8795136.1 RNA-binding protein 33 [Biomphalaria glabrata]